jgi:hypothetical protein
VLVLKTTEELRLTLFDRTSCELFESFAPRRWCPSLKVFLEEVDRFSILVVSFYSSFSPHSTGTQSG